MTKAYYGNPELIQNTLEGLFSGSSDGAIETYRLDPAPFVSITVNYNYSSDNIIGHNYSVNLNAVLASDAEEPSGGIGSVINKIHKIENILSTYGGTLYITDNDYNILVKATGGTLKSMNFDNSNNSWSRSAPYAAQIDFQEIELNNVRGCDNVSIDEESFAASLVDINKYKIKSFNDNWSFNIEDDVYSTININNLSIDNLTFGVSYTINAIGQHYFIYDGTGEQTVTPAWENARKFCTDRLYSQLTLRISEILDINANDHCSSSETLDQIYKIPAETNNLILGGLWDFFYVFNEQITCSASESDGTFSVTYNATVKRANNNDYYKHTFTINEKHNHGSNQLANNGQSNKTITVDGTIEGLVLGGILYAYNGNFLLPSNGRITPNSLDYNPKYTNAVNGFNSILNNSLSDFSDQHKENIGITFSNLNVNNGDNFCSNIITNYPKVTNFTITQNINEGTINYNAEYSTDVVCGQKYSNVSVSIQKANPIINNFDIPNGKFRTPMNPLGIGTILQYVGANTNTIMDISIQGRDSNLCCIEPNDISSLLNVGTSPFIIPGDINLPLEQNSILTKKTKDLNITTGSYTINLSYIICDDGCSI